MKIENISNMISSDTSSIPTNFSNNFSEVLNDNVCSTCISFPTYGIILIALCLVGLLILTGFVSFIFTKLYYTKIWEKRITNEYQEMQRRQLSENSYERIDVANVFTGISNVNITYERLNKLYSINLNQEGSNAVPEISLPNNPVYDDCINMDSGSSA
ncbi:uncharacterized protein LOC134241028 [Saccostrea cucullata]|uniref:uncharacterized protein LOC134241028 n=1 Tax=Saccostrea cuccullata TaxID=36930 RepID=UPI002ED49E8B